MPQQLRIVALLGSLRATSFNKSILDYASAHCPADAKIEIAEIKELPLFNADFETNLPETVKTFKAKIKSADAILLVTPEYNYSIPGALKNAIDWGSRPYTDNSFFEKPVGIMTASTGPVAGSRCQYHLRQCFVFLNMFCLNRPEMMVGSVQEKIVDGQITDEHTKTKVVEYLTALIAWTKKLAH